MTDHTAAAAFAAVEAIMSGQWDRYLHRVRGACMLRAQTDEYQATLICGTEPSAGEGSSS